MVPVCFLRHGAPIRCVCQAMRGVTLSMGRLGHYDADPSGGLVVVDVLVREEPEDEEDNGDEEEEDDEDKEDNEGYSE